MWEVMHDGSIIVAGVPSIITKPLNQTVKWNLRGNSITWDWHCSVLPGLYIASSRTRYVSEPLIIKWCFEMFLVRRYSRT
jgi:hypothetical protein